MAEGSYSLLIRVEDAVIEIGALGGRRFPAGFYAYNGSAFGPGGLARVDRHRRVFEDGTDSPHWHIDHLACHDASELLAVYVTDGEDLECELSQQLPGDRIEGFGCSDCGCDSHLVHCPDRSVLAADLARYHDRRFK